MFKIHRSGSIHQIVGGVYKFIEFLANAGYTIKVYDPDIASKDMSDPATEVGHITHWWIGEADGKWIAYLGTPESFRSHYGESEDEDEGTGNRAGREN